MTGSGSAIDPFVIWDVNDLQDIDLHLKLHYELGQDIDASVTSGWDAGKGFDPIGKLDLMLTSGGLPTSDISSTGTWIVFPAIPATKYDKVDDGPTSDGDSTYIQSGNTNESIVFGIDGFTLHPDSTDLSVVMHCVAKKTSAAICQLQRYIRISGTNYAVGSVVTISSSSYYSDYYYTVPNPLPGSGGVWSISDIEAIEGFGFVVVDDSAHFRLTSSRLVVGYDIGFRGSFNGKSHTISNLAVNRPTEDYVGLFGYTEGVVLQNTKLTGASIVGGMYVGTLVGMVVSCTISDVTVESSIVTASGPFLDAGGFIGYAEDSNISDCSAQVIVSSNAYGAGFIAYLENSTVHDCSATGNITGTDYYIGGFISEAQSCTIYSCYSTGNVVGRAASGGFIGGAEDCTIYDCYSTGDVDASSEIGGLIGYLIDSTMYRCYATGDVTGSGNYVGGLIGDPSSSVIYQCFALGNVIGVKYVGGLIGDVWYESVTDCYSRGNATGNSNVGGLIGRNLQCTLENCYSTGVPSGSSVVGGLLGFNDAGTVTNCFWDTQTSGQATSDGGTGKTTEEMNHLPIFIAAGWDFATVWNISQVTTGLSTNVTPGSAVLGGLLDLTIINEAYPFLRWQTIVELPCDCGFEWGETDAFGNFTPVDSKNTGESFAKALAGLEPNMAYYFRARAHASPGPIHGATKSFTTLVGIEVETLPATNITENSARIWGRVRKVPVTAMAKFQWGGNIEYGAQTPWAQGLVSDDMFYYDLSNLAEGRAYHFRAMAMGSALVYGNDMVFTTRSPVGPVVLIQEELAHLMEVS